MSIISQNSTDAKPYHASSLVEAVEMLIECYVRGYGYTIMAPQAFEHMVFAVYDKEQDVMLMVTNVANVVKTNSTYDSYNFLTNGEVRLAQIDNKAA